MKKSTSSSSSSSACSSNLNIFLVMSLLILLSSYSGDRLLRRASANKLHCFVTREITVSIQNQLPTTKSTPPLLARCQDKGHDSGMKSIPPNIPLEWSFCNNVFGKSLYFCHLYWGKKQKLFDVFSDELYNTGGCQTGTDIFCVWEAVEDGIYNRGAKQYDWD